jgi:hypothetical protein
MRRRRDDWTIPRQIVSFERNGIVINGNYQVEAGMIRVTYLGASKTTQLERSPIKLYRIRRRRSSLRIRRV